MGLLDDLRKGRIDGPVSRKFDARRWEEMFGEKDRPEDELALIETGLFIHETLNDLRSRLAFTSRVDVPSAFKKAGILFLVNRDCLQAELELRELSAALTSTHGLLSMDSLSSQTLALPAGEFSPDDIAESANDTGEALLKLIRDDDSRAEATANFDVGDIANELRIAFAYRATEDLWADVIWRSYRMAKLGGAIRFASANLEVEALRSKSLYRHVMQMSQAVSIGAALLPDNLPLGNIGDETLGRELEALISVRSVTRAIGIAPYYAAKQDVPGPRFPMLTLRTITTAFDVVSIEAERICTKVLSTLNEIEKGELENDAVQPTQYACIMESAHLVARIAIRARVEVPVARELLNFLTLGCNQRQAGARDDIWSAPCVQLDHLHTAVAQHPVRRGNILRLTDIWLRRLGFDLDFRGSGFEIHARETIANACQRSALADISIVFSRELTFTDGTGRREEIDLLIVLGNQLLIGELKCFLAPTTPLDWANHQEKIADAAAQIARKATAIQSSLAPFRARAEQLGLALPVDFVLVPLVVLNHALGAGQSIDGIPVVDLRIVEMYFEGELASFCIVNPDGAVQRGPTTAFYENPKMACEKISEYLHRPPQLLHLQDAIRPRPIAIHASKADRLYTIERLDVDGQAVFENAVGRMAQE